MFALILDTVLKNFVDKRSHPSLESGGIEDCHIFQNDADGQRAEPPMINESQNHSGGMDFDMTFISRANTTRPRPQDHEPTNEDQDQEREQDPRQEDRVRSSPAPKHN
jgi:hypothetical protein